MLKSLLARLSILLIALASSTSGLFAAQRHRVKQHSTYRMKSATPHRSKAVRNQSYHSRSKYKPARVHHQPRRIAPRTYRRKI